jgi:hypothetical protein
LGFGKTGKISLAIIAKNYDMMCLSNINWRNIPMAIHRFTQENVDGFMMTM